MDQLKGAFNAFSGSKQNQNPNPNQNQYQQGGNQYQQEGGQYQQGSNQYQQGGGYDQYPQGGQNQYQGQQMPQGQSSQQQQTSGGGGFFGGITDKFNSAAGGGRESEKNEDYLDKGVDFVQERFLGKGPQDNESAVEQAKDEQISDFIRNQYKSTTGKEFFVKDKETRFG